MCVSIVYVCVGMGMGFVVIHSVQSSLEIAMQVPTVLPTGQYMYVYVQYNEEKDSRVHTLLYIRSHGFISFFFHRHNVVVVVFFMLSLLLLLLLYFIMHLCAIHKLRVWNTNTPTSAPS